jgi:hypothetical protein
MQGTRLLFLGEISTLPRNEPYSKVTSLLGRAKIMVNSTCRCPGPFSQVAIQFLHVSSTVQILYSVCILLSLDETGVNV